MMRVDRISSSMRGSTPGRMLAGANATPLGATTSLQAPTRCFRSKTTIEALQSTQRSPAGLLLLKHGAAQHTGHAIPICHKLGCPHRCFVDSRRQHQHSTQERCASRSAAHLSFDF
jgi:hypothetical protein